MKRLFLSILITLPLWGGGHNNYGAVTNETYKKECGSCHMAYQPALLNKSSWMAMMDNLAHHFGTDASLEPTQVGSLKEYLARQSWDKNKKVYKAISTQEWFVREHREIPTKYVTQANVKSWANCNACHIQADKGFYGERYINIPGYGKWED